ncbi:MULTISPECIES: hydrolase [Cytobacillus]|uniref:Hydrolase n=1 Tax=Cytobacillus stercorigallinarum TaxID=2762240 RepID=A0ABR8QSE6_9BACI|nr:hydrolase [Cytobacillus stercorigallinarum]MBD7938197.1 hydrolase [Cytobacillus stercorigallinarum]
MDGNREAYFINLENGTILDTMDGHDWQFRVYATGAEIAELNRFLDENYHAELKTFARAQVPFLEYHKKSPNPEYDQILMRLYEMIYQLGDQEAKNHIEEMNIIDTDKI